MSPTTPQTIQMSNTGFVLGDRRWMRTPANSSDGSHFLMDPGRPKPFVDPTTGDTRYPIYIVGRCAASPCYFYEIENGRPCVEPNQ